MEWLPDSVLKIAHVLPSYYYIKSNNLLTEIEEINFETLKPVLTNIGGILIFAIVFVIITNLHMKSCYTIFCKERTLTGTS